MFIPTRTKYFPPTVEEILCNNLPPGRYSGGLGTYWESMLVSDICKLVIQYCVETNELDKWKYQLLTSCISCIPVSMAKLPNMSIRQGQECREEPD